MTPANSIQNCREEACPEAAVQRDRGPHVGDPRDARLGFLVILVTAAVFYGALGSLIWHLGS